MQFQQCGRKVFKLSFFTLSTLHLCTLQIFIITKMDPEHDRNRPEKSKTFNRIEVLLSTFPLAPSKQCCSDHAQMSNWDCQHCVVGARGSDYELQLNIFYLAVNMLVNGSDKHTMEVISSKPLLEWFFRSVFGNTGRLQWVAALCFQASCGEITCCFHLPWWFVLQKA